jgi:hypothetical protein
LLDLNGDLKWGLKIYNSGNNQNTLLEYKSIGSGTDMIVATCGTTG